MFQEKNCSQAMEKHVLTPGTRVAAWEIPNWGNKKNETAVYGLKHYDQYNLRICEPSVVIANNHLYLTDGFKNKIKKNQYIQIKESFRAKPKRGPAIIV